MRLIANFLTEFLNVYKISQTRTVEDVVKDFIAFGIISEIDEVIARSFLQLDVEQEVSGSNITYPKEQDETTILQIMRNYWNEKDENAAMRFFKIMRIGIYGLLNVFYVSLYFYFFPFLIIIMIYALGDDKIDS
jgi:hypothetical protein